MPKTVYVPGYKTKKWFFRKGKPFKRKGYVKGFNRKHIPTGKKHIISKKPIKLYLIQDKKTGRILGYSTKPGSR